MLNKQLAKFTFLDDAENYPYDVSKVFFLGVAFDLTSSYGKGSWFGAQALLNASWQIWPEMPFSKKTLFEIVKVHNAGILEYPKEVSEKEIETLASQMVADVKELSKKPLKDGKLLLVCGGEHSVAIGALQAVAEQHNPKDVTIVQFDAHTDLCKTFHGGGNSHACVMRRAKELGFNLVQIGVRDRMICAEEQEYVAKEKHKGNIFYCAGLPKDFYEGKLSDAIDKDNLIYNGKLSQEQIKRVLSKINTKYVWLSIDLDCLDSSIMPGTGTPMPFGLSFDGLYDVLYAVIKFCRENKKRVVGVDVTELKPMMRSTNTLCYVPDDCVTNVSEMNAAIIVYDVLRWAYE